MSPKPKKQNPHATTPTPTSTPTIPAVSATPPDNPPNNSPLIRTNSEFIVDTIFPRNEIHIIGGSSHSGKTTLLFHIINLWSRREQVFTHNSFPVPFCYVSAVHSLTSVKTSAARIGVPPQTVILSTVDEDEAISFEDLLGLAQSRVKGLEVLFLDGIHTFCNGSIVEYAPVASFLKGAIRMLKARGITLIASGRCTKNRESYRASNPCDRFMGSTAWSEFTSTFIAVEPRRPEDPRDRGRRVLVMPKNAPGEMWEFEFGPKGTLIEAPTDSNGTILTSFKLDAFNEMVFSGYGSGEEISSKTMKEFAECAEISDRSLYRHLTNLITEGRLTKSKWGTYRISSMQ